MERAQNLIEAGEAESAYNLLLEHFDQRRGDPDYDLLLGIAALDAGYYSQSVFALERVLAQQPDNPRARAELGRAYFELGENEASQEEFDSLRDRGDLPDSVAQTIDQYITAIDARMTDERSHSEFYVEMLVGSDTNINSATDLSLVALPAFGNLLFQLNEEATSQNSPLFGLAIGGNASRPLTRNLNVFGDARLSHRNTPANNDFSQTIANGRVGLSYQDGPNRYIVSANARQFRVGNDVNQESIGGTVQVVTNINQLTQLSVFGQTAALHYPDQSIRDVKQVTLGTNLVRLFDRPGMPLIFAGIYGGTEFGEDQRRSDLARDFIGGRLGGRYNVSEKSQFFVDAGYQYSNYGDPDPLFQRVRKDDYLNIGAGITHAFTDDISVRPEIRYQRNNSTLPINDYDRWQALLTIRKTF